MSPASAGFPCNRGAHSVLTTQRISRWGCARWRALTAGRVWTTSPSELGLITKKWAGLGKELFTTADNYMISLHGSPDAETSLLLLAAGLAVDTVFKEKQ